MSLGLREVLGCEAMREAVLLAGSSGVDKRMVRWPSVHEWPLEGFVRSEELILTTASGCDARRLYDMVRQAIGVGAAALAVALHPDTAPQHVPQEVLDLADAHDLPVLELPWSVHFADIVRNVVDILTERHFAGSGQREMHREFIDAVLAGTGVEAIANALEKLIDRPVLLLNADLRPVACSPGGHAHVEAVQQARGQLDVDAIVRVRALLGGTGMRWLPSVEMLGLGAARVSAVPAQGERLAYLVVVDASGEAPPPLTERAVDHAGVACALQLLQEQARRTAREELRAAWLWDLVLDVAGSGDLQVRAELFEMSLEAHWWLAVASFSERQDALSAATTIEGSCAGVITALRAHELLVLSPERAQDTEHALLNLLKDAPLGGRWGLSAQAVALAELAGAYQRALVAQRLTQTLGMSAVGDPRELGAFMMLGRLSEDTAAVAAAREAMAGLLQYDRLTERSLIKTLDVFLREHGNTSSTARALYFNRSSLMYRLRKIESLTGRCLDHPDDRFILELSLRLLALCDPEVRQALGRGRVT